MAEKNTLSILETIKKKMHKLDQKTDKGSKVSSTSDEFEYISSTNKQATPQSNEVKVAEPTPPENAAKSSAVTLDDLDLDTLEEEVRAAEKAPASNKANAKEQPVLDDFNLDDLDLDSEVAAEKAPAKEETHEEEEEFSEDDVEDYEDEIDFDEEGEAEAMAEIEDNTLTIEDESQENLDWLGNEKEEIATKADDLEFPEELEEAEPVEEEQEVEEGREDDLNLDEFELPDENMAMPKEQAVKSDDLDFADLDLEGDFEEKQLPEFEEIVPTSKPQEQSKNAKDIEDFLEKKPVKQEWQQEKPMLKEPISLEDEIDLEFEKEIMGLKPEVIEKDEGSVNQTFEQIFPQPITPIQNNISAVNQVSFVAKPEPRSSAIIYDSTLRQTSDSIKKLLDAKNVVSGITSFSQGSAFAELAMQLMEPKMEKWLNEHLPDLVEKIVREEIKKIIPKE